MTWHSASSSSMSSRGLGVETTGQCCRCAVKAGVLKLFDHGGDLSHCHHREDFTEPRSLSVMRQRREVLVLLPGTAAGRQARRDSCAHDNDLRLPEDFHPVSSQYGETFVLLFPGRNSAAGQPLFLPCRFLIANLGLLLPSFLRDQDCL